jgi:hypothetical protein
VLTPKVAAHPDGVHIQFDNRLGQRAESFTKGGVVMAIRIPRGKSNQKFLTLFPPGTHKISCSVDEKPTSLSEDFEDKYAYFEVVEGDSGYKSLELECAPGAHPESRFGIASGAGGNKVELVNKFKLVSYRVEEAREYYKKGLKEGDVVEAAGYPKDPYPTVRVVRNGKVIATYWPTPMEWSATYCSGQI